MLPFLLGSMLLSCPAFAVSPSPVSIEETPENSTHGQNASKEGIPLGDYLSGKFAESNGDSDKSIKFLHESLSRDPHNKDIMLNLYYALVSAGDIAEAASMAKKLPDAMADDNNEFSPQFLLTLESAKRGQYAEAEKHLRSIPKAGFNSVLVPLLQIWLKCANGEIKIPVDTKDILPNGKMLMAHIYLHAGLIDELSGFKANALQNYEAAAKETRLESMRAAEALANYYLREGEKDKYIHFDNEYSAVHGETVIDNENVPGQLPRPLVSNATEGMAEAIYTVASIFHGVRTPADEITSLKMALYLRPDFPAAHFLLASAYEINHAYPQAIASYKLIPQESPYFLQSRIMTAYDRSETNEKAAALAELDKIATEKPHMISALLAKGDILRSTNEYSSAIDAYNTAISRIKTPEKPHWIIFFSRGICYERIGNFEKTEADMRKALMLSRDEPDVLNYLGYSWLTRRHNIAEARKMIEEAYDARPEDPQIIDSMGYALFAEGDFSSAQEYFERALERIPDDPTINEHLGDTYWQLGRKTEAGYQWQRALEDKPDEDNKKELLKKISTGMPQIVPLKSAEAKKSAKSTAVQ